MKKNALIILLCLFTSALFFISCEKTNYEVVSYFNVRLGATAFDAAQVNLNIEQVKVNYEDTSWTSLNTTGQTFNLLDYQNTDTLLATGKLPATRIVRQVKLVLGRNHTIKLEGKDLPMTLQGNNEIVLDVNRKLNRNQETVLVNVNTSQSIRVSGDGSYQFVPVIELTQ